MMVIAIDLVLRMANKEGTMTTDWRDLLADAMPEGEGTRARVHLPVIPSPSPKTETRLKAPLTREELRQWCKEWLEVALPKVAVCPHHNTPLDYLEYVFFERGDRDPLIWACRGGGKTLLGAVATLLDMLFKPGIEIRILGGSQAQSERMYEHLVRMVESRFRDQMIRGGKVSRITKSGFAFANGSRVELLGQSETSVRGARVQKVRCDEVDLFDPNVWDAVQLTTRSRGKTRGTIEAFSTMNGPSGVMSKLIKEGRRKCFTWCVWDVIEKCQEACDTCILSPDCQEKARQAEGFIPVSDVRTMRERVGDRTWRYEVLCEGGSGGNKGWRLEQRFY
jgi:hypothetical protein